MSEESMARLGFALLLVKKGIAPKMASAIAFSKDPDVFAAAFKEDQ